MIARPQKKTSGAPHIGGFDPTRWLCSFTNIGGGYALTADGRLNLFVGDCDGEKLAQVMAAVAGHPDRQQALKSAIQQRQCGEV